MRGESPTAPLGRERQLYSKGDVGEKVSESSLVAFRRGEKCMEYVSLREGNSDSWKNSETITTLTKSGGGLAAVKDPLRTGDGCVGRREEGILYGKTALEA